METGQMSPRPESPNSTLRMSTFHEYHNAPEVATAHGLEYDDTVYPSSDKYPVTHQRSSPPSYIAKPTYDSTTKSPRIIFGMKVRTFIVVAILFICITVGASVGGAVGGKNMNGGNTEDQLPQHTTTSQSSSSTSPKTIAASSATATSSTTSAAAATPTYTPLNDCPDSNHTSYSSVYSTSDSSTGLNFTKYCGVASPLSDSAFSATTITSAFVYSFDDCTEICATYNFYASSANCSVAVYKAAAERPANCWVGSVDIDGVSDLAAVKGTAVAIVDS